MPITIRKNNIKIKGQDGEYHGLDVLADNTTAEEIAAIQAKGQEILDSLPADYTDLSEDVAELQTQISNETTARSSSDYKLSEEIAVERERITNLATLDEGSTTGDAELIDIRVGANGTTYESAGAAVRSQVADLMSAIDEDVDLLDGKISLANSRISANASDIDGLETDMDAAQRDIRSLSGEYTDLSVRMGMLEPEATAEDVGKALIAKTVTGGKVIEYEFGEVVTIDNTLTQEGQAADAKAVGDAITEIEPGLSDNAKIALLDCIRNIALWRDSRGEEHYQALYDALYATQYPMITVAFEPNNEIIYDDYDIEDLRRMLTVKYHTSSTEYTIVTNYTLSGSLTTSFSNVVVSYSNLSKVITVPVVVGRALTADDILSAIGTTGLTVDSNGNVDWATAQTFSVILFKNTIKHVRLTPRYYNANDVEIAPKSTWFAFKQVTDGVYAVATDSFFLFSSDGTKYNSTAVSGVSEMTSDYQGAFNIGMRIDVALNESLLKAHYSIDNYSGHYQLTNADIIGMWGNGVSSRLKMSNVRVYE